MAEMRWYKRDPTAALEGMSELTLEQRGAYNTILDLIYARGGSVIDDQKFLCGWLRCDVRVWKRLRQTLLDSNKLYLNGNALRNRRADHEVEEARYRMNIAAKAGLASAAKRRAIANATKEILSADLERPCQLSTPTSKTKTIFSSYDEPDFKRLTSPQLSRHPKNEVNGKSPSACKRSELEALYASRREAET